MGLSVLGMGIVSPYGAGVRTIWQGLLSGISSITAVAEAESGSATRFMARVDDGEVSARTRRRYGSRVAAFAVAAAEEAIEAAERSSPGVAGLDRRRVGVVVGTSGAIRTALDLTLDPKLIPALEASSLDPYNGIAQAIAETCGFSGPCASLNTACSSGAAVLAVASAWLADGLADLVIACGADEYTPFSAWGFDMVGAYASHPCAPFAISDGVNLGEGAGVMVVGRSRDFRAAELPCVLGVGLSSDAYHPTAPHPEGRGLILAIERALRRGGANIADIGYVNLHGTGTELNDAAEQVALSRLFSHPDLSPVYASGIKGGVGHTLGAAGMIEAIITVLAVQELVAPPTLNAAGVTARFRHSTGSVALVGHAAEPLSRRLGLSVNGAFGGHNAALLIGRSTDAFDSEGRTPELDFSGHAYVVAQQRSPRGDDAYRGSCHRLDEADLAITIAIEEKKLRRLGRLTRLAVHLVGRALEDRAVRTPDPLHLERCGLIVATARGPSDSYGELHAILSSNRRLNPALFPRLVMTYCAGTVSELFGIQGPNVTLTAGDTSAAAALSMCADLFRDSVPLDAVIVVAVDTVDEYLLDVPQHAGRQLYDAGAVIILEPLRDSRRRFGLNISMSRGSPNEQDQAVADLGAPGMLIDLLQQSQSTVVDPWGQRAEINATEQ
jgi:3-oxoacyl-[acyl-carrier-protein] synthase II